NDVFLLLGSNIGNRQDYIDQSIVSIDQEIGRVIIGSACYETDAWGREDQPKFLNKAIRVYTSHGPHRLLRSIHKIEQDMDRRRIEKWGPRTIDIDILLFNDEVVLEEGICIPHRQLHHRRFALTPLAEIGGHKTHPILFKSINQLLDQCPDPLQVYLAQSSHG
ncbi:UNVERIFIED_CONTAM: hypothetical protein GTU68_065926, partial [Idotea baltica]|nr:hypothetical protein [Idotea baltica]